MLVNLLGFYISNIQGNSLWDFTKAVWTRLTRRNPEDLFLDAFEAALKDEAPRLRKYGDSLVTLPREELHRVIHQNLAISISATSISELTDIEFSRQLVASLATQETLVIGGHNLAPEDYASLIQNVVQKAFAIFKAKIEEDPDAARQAILSEAMRQSIAVEQIRILLKDRFDTVLPELQEISSKVDNVQQISETTLHIVKNTRDDVKTGFEDVMKILQSRLPDEGEIERRIEEKLWNERIDVATQLLQEDKPVTAKAILEKLVCDIEGKEVSLELQFRLRTRLGGCYLHLNEYEIGIKHLDQALLYAPNNPKAIANAGVAALLRENFEQAINFANQALTLKPTESTALTVLLEASFRTHKEDELNDAILSEAEKHLESRRMLAILFAEKGFFAEAENLQRLNAEPPDEEPQDLALLAQLLIAKAQDERLHRLPIPWATSNKVTLLEAENLLT